MSRETAFDRPHSARRAVRLATQSRRPMQLARISTSPTTAPNSPDTAIQMSDPSKTFPGRAVYYTVLCPGMPTGTPWSGAGSRPATSPRTAGAQHLSANHDGDRRPGAAALSARSAVRRGRARSRLRTGNPTPPAPVVAGQVGEPEYQILGRRWVEVHGWCPGSAILHP